MTEWDLTGDWDPPPTRPALERFKREVRWPDPADEPEVEPDEPWATRRHDPDS